MDRGLYIAASGMLTELTRQDQIANDLANAATPGYKPDRSAQESFGELLLRSSSTGQVIGPLDLGARIAEVKTDLAPAPLRQTGEPLDLALDGEGFFAVDTPTGTRYTRDGQLVIDAKGQLATATGYPLLDDAGRPIQVGSPDGLTVGADGTVSRGGRTIARIGVVSLTGAVEQGDTLFAGTPGARPVATAVKQGYLEASGVSPTTAMVDMITSLRSYEADQRAIQAIDGTLQKGIAAAGVTA